MAALMPALVAAALVSREEGGRLAREELSDKAYGDAEPGLLERIYNAVADWLAELAAQVSTDLPGGWWLLGPVLVFLALLVAGLVLYTRPARMARRRGALVDSDAPLNAADHRERAERHAAAGEYAEAVRERLRAISRDLEDRAVVGPRLGRTATELASEASVALPGQRTDLYRAAEVFNDVWYGKRAATGEHYRLLRALDERLAAARPAAAAAGTAGGGR